MGHFITFEGPDGSGKSTQARLLVEALRARGRTVLLTREPGGTVLGERVRGLLLGPDSPPAAPLAATFLLSAARTQLVEDVILPGLAQDADVVCDRFADSTLAYQCFGSGVPRDAVEQVTELATGGLLPDITVLIDVPVEIGRERTAQRGGQNHLDEAGIAFQERVAAGYRTLAQQEPERWVVVNGTMPVNAVHDEVLRALAPVLGRMADRV